MSAGDRDAWLALREAGIVAGEAPPRTGDEAPWYVRALLGIAGWIAASFLLGFVAVGFGEILDHASSSILVGALLVVAAGLVIGAAAHNDFAAQLGLAVSFAGQSLLAIGLGRTFREDTPGLWLAIAAVEAVLAVAIALPVHRVWSALATAGALYLALRSAGLPDLGTGLLAAVVAGLWLADLRPRTRALVAPSAYGVTLALLAVEAVTILERLAFDLVGETLRPPGRAAWPGELLTGLVLLAVVWRLCGRAGAAAGPRERAAALLAATLTALASCQAPGIATGLMVVLLGFANGSRTAVGIGIVALLAAVSAFYYAIEGSLLAKAQVLAVMGVALLGVRAAALRWLWPAREAARA